MIRKPIAQRWRMASGVASVALLLLAYTYLAERRHAAAVAAENPNDTAVPTWGQLKDGLVKVVKPNSRTGDVWLWVDVKTTFGRLFSGLAAGTIGAVILGILMGCYPPVAAFFQPPLAFFAKIPPTAMLAVFFVLVGTGYEMYVSMIAFGVLPSLAQTIYHAAKEDVPDELIFKAYTLGASQAETIWNVIFRHILPKTLDAVRLQVGPAMVYLIAAEWVGVGDVGFGARIRLQTRLLDMSLVYVYLVFLGLAGYLIDQGLIALRRCLCPWYER